MVACGGNSSGGTSSRGHQFITGVIQIRISVASFVIAAQDGVKGSQQRNE